MLEVPHLTYILSTCTKSCSCGGGGRGGQGGGEVVDSNKYSKLIHVAKALSLHWKIHIDWKANQNSFFYI